MLQKYLDQIIEEFATGHYYKEVYAAKLEYFEKAGIVYEDDPEFEQRMCIFMDWYLFDRDLPGVDLPPIKYFFRLHKDTLSNEDLQTYKDLCSTIHSLFRLKGFGLFGNDLIVQDLFSGKKYKVRDTKMSIAFTKGDIFEARLIPFKGHYEFSKGFCFHPIEMEGFISAEIKKVRYQDKARQTKLILQLASMKLKHMRFQHIDIKHIYNFESRF